MSFIDNGNPKNGELEEVAFKEVRDNIWKIVHNGLRLPESETSRTAVCAIGAAVIQAPEATLPEWQLAALGDASFPFYDMRRTVRPEEVFVALRGAAYAADILREEGHL